MKVLFVAADRMEFRGLLARAADARPGGLDVDFSRRARVGTYEALLVANGVGWDRAAAAVDAAAGFAPAVIVNTGFCGAVDEALGVGDVVVASEVRCRGRVYECRRVEGGHHGPIASADHVAQTALEKRKLRKTGAVAVEMEAGGVAQRAAEKGIPFYCIRAVSDLAREDMANDFNGALRADGHFDTINVLRGALRNPTVRIPELLRLRGRCVRAAQALGDFIVGCRF